MTPRTVRVVRWRLLARAVQEGRGSSTRPQGMFPEATAFLTETLRSTLLSVTWFNMMPLKQS